MARQVPVLLAEEEAFGHAFLFVPVIVGVGAAIWFCLPTDPPFWPLLAGFIVFSLAAIGLRHARGSVRLMVIGLALLLTGMLLAELETRRFGTIILDSPVTAQITGIVEGRDVDAEGRWRYLVRLQTTSGPQLRRPPEHVSLLARARHDAANVGDRIAGRVRLSPPSGPALPQLNDFAFSSYFDGIGAVGFFYGAVEKLGPGPSEEQAATRVQSWLFELRAAVGERIRQTVPGDPGAFAAAIVTDERRAISKETTEALRLSGLAHIVAISGLNMALAAGIFFVGVRTVLSLFSGFAQRYPIKKIAALGALLMVTAYYLISGFGVSAERAYIMMAVALVAVLFDRQSLSLRNIALSALIIIAMSPSEVLGPSFQMSFAATVALIAGYSSWQMQRQRKGEGRTLLNGRHRLVTMSATLGHFVAGIVMTSLIGGLSTAIFSVDHFHRITTYGLAANLAAMPLISFVVMPMGLIGMLLMPFGLDGPFLKLMGLGLEGVIAIAQHVAAWGGDVGVGRQHPWFLALATLGFILLTLLRTRLRLLGVPIMAGALLLTWNHANTTTSPDLLVSEDGSLVGLRSSAGLAVNRSRVPDFIYDQWKRALILDEPIKPLLSAIGDVMPGEPERQGRAGRDLSEQNQRARSQPLRAQAGDDSKEKRQSGREAKPLTRQEIEAARQAMRQAPIARFSCRLRAWCAAKSEQGFVVVAVEDGRYAGAACDAAAIVIAPRARFDRCRSGALIVNGETLRKTGAMEITFPVTKAEATGAASRLRTASAATLTAAGAFAETSAEASGSAMAPPFWTIHTAMAGRNRPWTRHRLYNWRTGSFNEDLPDPLAKLINGSGG